MKRHRFEEIAGTRVSTYPDEVGEEECYVCSMCGKQKLYRNKKTGLWICFVCGIGGRSSLTSGNTSTRFTPVLHEHPQKLTDCEELFAKLRTRMDAMTNAERSNIIQNLVLCRGIHWTALWQGEIAYTRGALYIPLRTGMRVAGAHIYTPDGETRYRTLGKRGLWVTGRSASPRRYSAILIFEGLFDLMSVQQTLAMEDEVVGHDKFVFTAGDTVSDEQFTDLVELVFAESRSKGRVSESGVTYLPELTTILVMFDNDKSYPSMHLVNRLRVLLPHIEVKSLPAPQWPGVKDWDEAVQHNPRNVYELLKREIRA